MATETTGSKRTLIIVVATIATILVAVGIAVGVAAVRTDSLAADDASATTGEQAPGGVADKTLTLAAARIVYDAHTQAKESGDVEGFERSTCRQFIDDDMSLRGQKSVQDLLSVYARARKFVPVQFIDNPTVVGASGAAPEGKIDVSATVTDNRFVPPTTEERVITWGMSYEEGVWKFCPTTDPV